MLVEAEATFDCAAGARSICMIWLSALAASVVAEPADAVPVEVPAEVVAALPDSSDWRLVSMDCTADTRAEAALPIGVLPACVVPGRALADWVLPAGSERPVRQ